MLPRMSTTITRLAAFAGALAAATVALTGCSSSDNDSTAANDDKRYEQMAADYIRLSMENKVGDFQNYDRALALVCTDSPEHAALSASMAKTREQIEMAEARGYLTSPVETSITSSTATQVVVQIRAGVAMSGTAPLTTDRPRNADNEWTIEHVMTGSVSIRPGAEPCFDSSGTTTEPVN